MIAIDDLYIILPSGVCVFNYPSHSGVDPIVLCGYLTALNIVSKNLTKEGSPLNVVNMGKKSMAMYQGSSGLLFVAMAEKKIANNLTETFEKLETEFVKKFSNVIDAFGGEVKVFEPFTHTIDKFCEIKVVL